jgi:hypothetical protein
MKAASKLALVAAAMMAFAMCVRVGLSGRSQRHIGLYSVGGHRRDVRPRG